MITTNNKNSYFGFNNPPIEIEFGNYNKLKTSMLPYVIGIRFLWHKPRESYLPVNSMLKIRQWQLFLKVTAPFTR